MDNLTIRLVDFVLSKSTQTSLENQGFCLWQTGQDLPWLTIINLSQYQPSALAQHLKHFPSKNHLALLAPEQGELAAAAMQIGVQDYLLLPLEDGPLFSSIERLHRLEQPDSKIIAAAQISKQLLMLAHRAATTEASILLTGESGTGKEPLANYIHRHSSRAGKPFVAINCAAIPESMLESILFGHTKGAFTGASADKVGKFEQANGGTLLLDEIAEMPLILQAKLLRVLQEREVERLGGNQSITLDIRIIAATNKDLRQAVDAGEFREDLFYRLDVLPLKIAPLRERKADILPLAEHFLQYYGQQGVATYFSPQAQHALIDYDWPGNVRELENCIQRGLMMRRGQAIQTIDLGFNLVSETCVNNSTQGLKESKRQAEFQFIVDILHKVQGSRSQTAAELGMTTRALRYKLAQMRDAGIDVDQLLQRSGNAA
ncbi:sigma-54 interaction domain-containing protein [Shewanella frigidimarina]|uniref:sigma-54 interaction domain-containing protein n=1 Tax=Shewanella frigidimarina TaxID=56812 RepID=UPI003D79CC04